MSLKSELIAQKLDVNNNEAFDNWLEDWLGTEEGELVAADIIRKHWDEIREEGNNAWCDYVRDTNAEIDDKLAEFEEEDENDA